MRALVVLVLSAALLFAAFAPAASAGPTFGGSALWHGGYYSPRSHSGYYRPWGYGYGGWYGGSGWYRPRSYVSFGFNWPTYSYYAPTYYAPTYYAPAYSYYPAATSYYPSCCTPYAYAPTYYAPTYYAPSYGCGSSFSFGFGYTWR